MKKWLLFVSVLSLCSADVFGMHPRRGIAKAKSGQGILNFGRTGKINQLPVSDRRLHRGGVVQVNKTHLDKLNKDDLVSLVMQLGQKNESLRQKKEELTKNLETAERNNAELFENWKVAQGANKLIVSENDRLKSTAESYAVALINQSKDTGLRWLRDEDQRQKCIDGILQVVNNRELTESCQKFRGDSKRQLVLLAEAVKNSFDFLQKENEVRKRENEVSQSEIAFLKERLFVMEKQLQEKNDNRVKAVKDSVCVPGERKGAVLHNWMEGAKAASKKSGDLQERVVGEKNYGIFDENIGNVGASGIMTNRDEWSALQNQRDSGEMQDMMSDNDDSMSEQFAGNSGSMAVESRSVDLGKDCSYSGDFEGDAIHGMGTFHNDNQAFDISGSFVHGHLDLTKPIKFEGYDGRNRQFRLSSLINKDLKIEISVLMTVQRTSCANNSLCLIFSQKQSKNEGIILNGRFIYKGELDANDRPEGKGIMIRSTGEVRHGNLSKPEWLQE